MSVEKAIWTAYVDNPCRLFSIRELALHLNKSYPLIHQHVTRLLAQKKLLSKTIGKSILCFPNYQNSYTLLSLAQADQEKLMMQSANQPHLSLQENFFVQESLPGVLSVWKTQTELVFLLAHKSFQSKVEDVLKKTTLSQSLVFHVLDDALVVESLVQKQVVLFGFEQFHLCIKHNYALYASKFNVVSLDE